MIVEVRIKNDAGEVLWEGNMNPQERGILSFALPGGAVADGYHLNEVQLRTYGRKIPDQGNKSEVQKAAERGFNS